MSSNMPYCEPVADDESNRVVLSAGRRYTWDSVPGYNPDENSLDKPDQPRQQQPNDNEGWNWNSLLALGLELPGGRRNRHQHGRSNGKHQPGVTSSCNSSSSSSRRTSLDDSGHTGSRMIRRFKITSISFSGLFKRRSKAPEKMKNRLFGRNLSDICSPNLPPQIMEMLQSLYTHGPSTKQIFRRSSTHLKCAEARQKLDSGLELSFDNVQLALVTSLLKEFLCSLPDCLLMCCRYDEWLNITDVKDPAECGVLIARLIECLPAANQLLLRHLVCVLKHICDNSEVNEMTPHNMAVCIGQCLLWPSGAILQSFAMQSARKVVQVVENIITLADEIYGEQFTGLFSQPDDDSRSSKCCSEYDWFDAHDQRNSRVEAGFGEIAEADDVEIERDARTDRVGSISDRTVVAASVGIDSKTSLDSGLLADCSVIDKSNIGCDLTAAAAAAAVVDSVELSRRSQGQGQGQKPRGETDSGVVTDDMLSVSTFQLTPAVTLESVVSLDVNSINVSNDNTSQSASSCTRPASYHEYQSYFADFGSDDTTKYPSSNDVSFGSSGVAAVGRRTRCDVNSEKCHVCGVVTTRGNIPRAKRRLSLPSCIHTCRCLSGMTENGSDLFPSRILPAVLLPTVFEDDMLTKPDADPESINIDTQLSMTEQYALPVQLHADNDVSVAQKPRDERIRESSQLQATSSCAQPDAISPCSGQPPVAKCKSPPTYVEALLHKVILQSGGRESSIQQQQQQPESAAQFDYLQLLQECGLVHVLPGLLPTFDDINQSEPVVSKHQSSDSCSRIINERTSVGQAECGEDAATAAVSGKLPPPAYDVATQPRKSSVAVDGHAIGSERSSCGYESVRETSISSGISNPSAVAMLEGQTEAGKNKPEMLDLLLTSHSAQVCSTSPVSSPLVPPVKSESVTNAGDVSSLPSTNVAASTGKLTSSQKRRAAKRRSMHSNSDTQIESVMATLATQSSSLYRSLSDCSALRSPKLRPASCKNKENLDLIRIPSLRKRLRSDGCKSRQRSKPLASSCVENVAPGPEGDSNNNLTAKGSSLAGGGVQAVRSETPKRQAMWVKDHEWYQRLLKQYRSEKSNDEANGLPESLNSSSSNVLYRTPSAPVVRLQQQQKLGSRVIVSRRQQQQQQLPQNVIIRPKAAVPNASNGQHRNWSRDDEVSKKRINVTWSVSKLREKYSNDSTDALQ